MSKIPYLHIITGIAAASVAFLPQRSLGTAIAVGLVAGAGSAVAQKVAQRSLGDLSQTIRQSHPNPELKDDSNLLKHYQERLKDINSTLETSRAEQQRLSRLVQEQERHISEKEGSLRASLAEQQRLSHEIQNYQRQVAQNQGSLKSALAECEKLSQLLQEAEQKVCERDQYLEIYEDEIKKLQDQIAGYQASLESLVQTKSQTNYVQINHNTENLSRSGLVLAMDERDLYPGEIKSFIMKILNQKKSLVHPNSRIYHILDDLVRNNDYTNGEEFRDQLETCLDNLFRNYQKWNPSMENELSRLHFDVISMNNHIKVRFCNDNRYTISFSKTPSDWRVGLNIIRDIRNTIFGLPE